ncbi:DUF2218 domain-containing protein [Vibrio alginolyticus]|nr:DUF2218 domain-containing protein [Vibrio alginolyticus]
MIKESTRIDSEHADKYLVTLCRHFGRKVPATWNENSGLVTFPTGKAEFNLCASSLTITCEADSEEKLNTVKAIISSQVDMFSRRETLALSWVR